MSSTTLASVTHAVIAIAVVVSATVLLALHDIAEPLAISLYTVALTAVGAATGIKLAKDIPPDAGS